MLFWGFSFSAKVALCGHFLDFGESLLIGCFGIQSLQNSGGKSNFRRKWMRLTYPVCWEAASICKNSSPISPSRRGTVLEFQRSSSSGDQAARRHLGSHRDAAPVAFEIVAPVEYQRFPPKSSFSVGELADDSQPASSLSKGAPATSCYHGLRINQITTTSKSNMRINDRFH